MRSISEFFSKIQNRHAKGLFAIKSVQDSIKARAGVDVEASSVSFKGRVIALRGLSQSAKSQIYIKKSAILADISSQAHIIEDIRFY